jgi:hypothetical protein
MMKACWELRQEEKNKGGQSLGAGSPYRESGSQGLQDMVCLSMVWADIHSIPRLVAELIGTVVSRVYFPVGECMSPPFIQDLSVGDGLFLLTELGLNQAQAVC